MIDQPENINSNFQPINNNINQPSNLAQDPELYPTMQKVIEQSKEKILYDNNRDEEEKIGDEKDSFVKSGSISTKRKIDYNRLNEEFKDIFNKENSNINDVRRNLIHLIIVTAVVNCIAWELDCLFLNACYGENIEMERFISSLLFPFIIISIFLLYLLYVTVNFLRQTAIKISLIIYTIFSLLFIVIGIYSLVKGLQYNDEMAERVIKTLTKYEIDYYREIYKDNDNEEKHLKRVFTYKMVFTGILDLILGFLGIIIVIASIVFNSLLSQTTFDWRPPLRSHVRIARIKKAIELYTQNSESFINLFRAENPHYQLDEMENKDMNRFGRVKNMMGDSVDLSKDKKDNSNNQNNNIDNNNINNNNDEDEIILPKAFPKKTKLNKDDKNDKNSGSKNHEINNINNRDNISNVNNENEINTNSNNLINNKIENNEINTNVKKEDHKHEI